MNERVAKSYLQRTGAAVVDQISDVVDRHVDDEQAVNVPHAGIAAEEKKKRKRYIPQPFLGKEVASLTLITFDLETTGFGEANEITQIGAAVEQSRVFSTYVMPTTNISEKASEITGITVQQGTMYHKGVRVDAKEQKVALTEFLSWLSCRNSKVVLVAHNCFAFDARLLLKSVLKQGLLESFLDIVTGFVDTLPLSRHLFNKEKSHSLTSIINRHNIVINTGSAHDALYDARALLSFLDKLDIDKTSLNAFSTTAASLVNYLR